MGHIEESLRDKFIPALFGGEDTNANFRKILDHSVKHCGLSITHPRSSSESSYNTSKVASGELVDSLLGGKALNYVGHRACIYGSIADTSKDRKQVEVAEMARKKELSHGTERNRFNRATKNWA